MTEKTTTCFICGERKPWSRMAKYADGRPRNRCKACEVERVMAWKRRTGRLPPEPTELTDKRRANKHIKHNHEPLDTV